MKLSRIISLLCLCVIAIFICIFLSLALGARSVELSKVISALLNSGDVSFDALVVRERIPRTIFSIIAGASLGVAGALMQAVTRNPIADPAILGVNTGASLFVVCGIAFFQINTANKFILFALAGAALTSAVVYRIGSLGAGGATPIKLALAGAASSAALSSLVSMIVLPRTEAMNDYRFWQVGSTGGATWEGILAVSPFLAAGLIIGILTTPALNALALGDDVATGLGVRVGTVRFIGAMAGVILCGATTAIAGPIGFVGLMVPHTMRLICGPNLKYIVPMSAAGGAVLLTLADILGRLAGGAGELEAGIITAFLGAPVMIFIAMRTKVHKI
ncbi:MAG: iron ABC transporter permease [Clostridiaceae bacterium]|nr:iron ABC transporter permease [Clostridiaceae bacterium]